MVYTKGGPYVEAAQRTLNLISPIYGLARDKGIVAVRFFNSRRGKRNVTGRTVRTVLKGHDFEGTARIGTELKRRIIDRFVSSEPGKMEKPLLVVTITNGKVGTRKHRSFLFLSAGVDSFIWLRSMARIRVFWKQCSRKASPG